MIKAGILVFSSRGIFVIVSVFALVDDNRFRLWFRSWLVGRFCSIRSASSLEAVEIESIAIYAMCKPGKDIPSRLGYLSSEEERDEEELA